VYAINGSLPITLNIFMAKVFSLIGVFVVTSYSLPWFSFSLFPLSFLYYKIQVIKLKNIIFIKLLEYFSSIKRIIIVGLQEN